MVLAHILHNSNYKLEQFSNEKISRLQESVFFKKDKNSNEIAYINCMIRNKEIKLTPEEIVRQLYLMVLIDDYGYNSKFIQVEYAVKTGSTTKRADIVIFEEDHISQPYIIIELKKPNSLEGKKQLESYCKFEGASIGVWTNGSEIEYYFKQENPKTKTTYLEKLSYLPKAYQTLSDVLNVKYTIKQLILNDKLQDKTLKDLSLIHI